uniref:Uncharacterized protein n=1 Tax=Rhizophora mucronata TaxID=61149 RepID=A0A2P2R3N1_RHIMU
MNHLCNFRRLFWESMKLACIKAVGRSKRRFSCHNPVLFRVHFSFTIQVDNNIVVTAYSLCWVDCFFFYIVDKK